MEVLEDIRKYCLGYEFKEPWTGREGYRLFYNENFFLSEEYYETLLEDLNKEILRIYSDPNNLELRTKLGEFFNIDPENIFPGNGVDYIISRLLDLASILGKRVVVIEPTYGMYREKARARLLQIKSILLRKEDFSLPVSDICSIAGKGDFVIICSPNNPTGNRFKEEELLSVVEHVKGTVIIDETYVEYSDGSSMIEKVPEYSNLIVLRSFSKAWGLAGIRFGFATASKEIVKALCKISEPYNISTLTRAIIIKALELYRYVKKSIEDTRKVRDYMFKEMLSMNSVLPYPSEANFILFKVRNSNIVKERLARRRFLVRDVSYKPLLKNCLRVTVVPRKLAIEFLNSLESILYELNGGSI